MFKYVRGTDVIRHNISIICILLSQLLILSPFSILSVYSHQFVNFPTSVNLQNPCVVSEHLVQVETGV
jgi:hypothetical protein